MTYTRRANLRVTSSLNGSINLESGWLSAIQKTFMFLDQQIHIGQIPSSFCIDIRFTYLVEVQV